MNYLEMIKQFVEPTAKVKLSGFIQNLDEKLKDPNSQERKLLASYVALIFNTSMAEKAVAEAQTFLNYIEQLLNRSQVAS